MDFAEAQTVLDDRKAVLLVVADDVGRIEELAMPEAADGALCLVGEEDSAAELRLMEALSDDCRRIPFGWFELKRVATKRRLSARMCLTISVPRPSPATGVSVASQPTSSAGIWRGAPLLNGLITHTRLCCRVNSGRRSDAATRPTLFCQQSRASVKAAAASGGEVDGLPFGEYIVGGTMALTGAVRTDDGSRATHLGRFSGNSSGRAPRRAQSAIRGAAGDRRSSRGARTRPARPDGAATA